MSDLIITELDEETGEWEIVDDEDDDDDSTLDQLIDALPLGGKAMRFSTDASGHEHKGKGEGGGQFTSKGGSGSSINANKKYERHELERFSDTDLAEIKDSTNKDRVKRLADQIIRERIKVANRDPVEMERQSREFRERETERQRPIKEAITNGSELISKAGLSKQDSDTAIELLSESESPREAKRYSEAVVSWSDPSPEVAAIDWVVDQLKERGIVMEQKGGNYSWYGMTEDGQSVRVGDHIGFDAHDIDITFDKPPTRESAASQFNDAMGE